MARRPAPAPQTLALQGDLDIFSIHAQWEQIQALHLSDGAALALDLSGIGDLDLSGVQLLAALDRDLRAKGGSLSLAGVQPAWQAKFGPLGWTDLFHPEGA